MKPMPADIAARWAPMWPQDNPTRPWWQHPTSSGGLGPFGSGGSYQDKRQWVRVDGLLVRWYEAPPAVRKERPDFKDGWYQIAPDPSNPDMEFCRGPGGGPFSTDLDPMGGVQDALQALDIETPLPAPLLLPGQVWTVGGGHEWLVTTARGNSDPTGDGGIVLILDSSGDPIRLSDKGPPGNAFLVAGPSRWGRDVPWAPTFETKGEAP